MTKCAVCKNRIVFGGIEREGERFCDRRCLLVRYPLFWCEQCLAETTDEGPGQLGMFNGTGTTLRDKSGIPPCPVYGSHVARVWYKMMFIPVVPLGWYRVHWVTRPGFATAARFQARKLRDEAIPGRSPPRSSANTDARQWHRPRQEPTDGGSETGGTADPGR
jgi:hypothetical protein